MLCTRHGCSGNASTAMHQRQCIHSNASTTSVISASRIPAAHPTPGNRREIGPGGAGARKSRIWRFLADFLVFWQSKHAGGILRGTALTGQSFSPNGGFPTPFVPDLMFSGRFWPRYIACLNSQQAVVASQQPQYAVVAQQQPLCGCHTASVWLPHRGSLCGCHTASLYPKDCLLYTSDAADE